MQKRQRAQSSAWRLGHIQERGTLAVRGAVRGRRYRPPRVLAVEHAQRHRCYHADRTGDGHQLHKPGVPAAQITGGRRRYGAGVTAATVDGMPGVGMGHGEFRAAAVPGRAKKGQRASVGPRKVRQEPEGHEARRQVQFARRVLVRRRRRARGRV